MMASKTHEVSRLNQEVASFENTKKDLEKRLQEALKNQCNHGDTKITNEVLIKYLYKILSFYFLLVISS